MSIQDIEKLAPLLGWRKASDHHGEYWECKQGDMWDWCAETETEALSDAEAITLLPVLVEQGYDWALSTMQLTPTVIWCRIFNSKQFFEAIKPTIAEAITTAVLKLIESEK